MAVVPARNVNAARSTPVPVKTTALRAGDQIAERAYQNDRIEWKLPAKRLAHFRKAGVIIKEERHITNSGLATVESVGLSGAVLRVHERVITMDVPRRQMTTTEQSYVTRLALDSRSRTSHRLSIVEAAMAGLPFKTASAGHVGQHWHTQVAVMTTLGSGSAWFEHAVAGMENGLLEISVRGRGEITGLEYHLPKLLPGSIELIGSAWYDPVSGLITQESYLIHNRLLKPAEGEQIGFDELLTVDTSSRLATSGTGKK